MLLAHTHTHTHRGRHIDRSWIRSGIIAYLSILSAALRLSKMIHTVSSGDSRRRSRTMQRWFDLSPLCRAPRPTLHVLIYIYCLSFSKALTLMGFLSCIIGNFHRHGDITEDYHTKHFMGVLAITSVTICHTALNQLGGFNLHCGCVSKPGLSKRAAGLGASIRHVLGYTSLNDPTTTASAGHTPPLCGL